MCISGLPVNICSRVAGERPSSHCCARIIYVCITVNIWLLLLLLSISSTVYRINISALRQIVSLVVNKIVVGHQGFRNFWNLNNLVLITANSIFGFQSKYELQVHGKIYGNRVKACIRLLFPELQKNNDLIPLIHHYETSHT